MAHDKAINGLDVSPDDALVATASQDRTAKVWRLPHLLPVATLRGHRRGVWDARVSPAARLVATASGDATVRLWSLPDGRRLPNLLAASPLVVGDPAHPARLLPSDLEDPQEFHLRLTAWLLRQG